MRATSSSNESSGNQRRTVLGATPMAFELIPARLRLLRAPWGTAERFGVPPQAFYPYLNLVFVRDG